MAEQEGEVVVDCALAVVQVGVANAASLDAHQSLALAGVGHVYRNQFDARALRARDDTLNFVDRH